MRPVAIYAAVVTDLDTPVSKSTIENELRRRLTIQPVELWQDDAGAYRLVLIRAVALVRDHAVRATVRLW